MVLLAERKKLRFEDTLDFQHVDILAGSVVHAVQQHHAAASGKSVRYRIQVSTFDAACRIVAANLAIAIVSLEVTGPFEQALGLKAIPLADSWARRKFVICVRDYEALIVSARLLVDSLQE